MKDWKQAERRIAGMAGAGRRRRATPRPARGCSTLRRAGRCAQGGHARHDEANERRAMEAERIDAIESELDRLIERRAREERDADATEELWKESARVHNEQRREALGLAWREHHLRMREVHARLASEYEARALRLLGGTP